MLFIFEVRLLLLPLVNLLQKLHEAKVSSLESSRRDGKSREEKSKLLTADNIIIISTCSLPWSSRCRFADVDFPLDRCPRQGYYTPLQ